jgi:enoyl-CoA hydratase/carnithine racemase
MTVNISSINNQIGRLHMSHQYRQLTIKRDRPSLWQVTIGNPPINMFDPDTFLELQQLVTDIEASDELNVVVFDSADPDFFVAHYNTARVPDASAKPGPTGHPPWTDFMLRMQRSPVVSVAKIRGRTRGVGSEFALICDIRFASLEKAIFGQPEVGAGLIPGGGGMERLPLLVGRARAAEIILGADDFDAATAERYGWINRAIPDWQLDEFVANFANRVASFERKALEEAKRLLNRKTLPTIDDFQGSQKVFLEAFGWPGTAPRQLKLREMGMGTRSDLEIRFGHYLPDLSHT